MPGKEFGRIHTGRFIGCGADERSSNGRFAHAPAALAQ
jgi:hypothetical protein